MKNQQLSRTIISDGFSREEIKDACTLDLGGGSAQITFIPKDSVIILNFNFI